MTDRCPQCSAGVFGASTKDGPWCAECGYAEAEPSRCACAGKTTYLGGYKRNVYCDTCRGLVAVVRSWVPKREIERWFGS